MTKKKGIIAIMGEKGHGKDHFADMIAHRLGAMSHEHYAELGIMRAAFADELKWICNILFPWQDSFMATEKNKEEPIPSPYNTLGLSYRELWCKTAQLLNEIEENYFITRMEMIVRRAEGIRLFMITDVRTPEEVAWCKRQGIHLFKVIGERDDGSSVYDSEQGSSFERFVRGCNDVDTIVRHTYNGIPDEYIDVAINLMEK